VAAVDTAVETEATTRQPAEPSQQGMLGELLVGRNLITHSQLAEALLQQSASASDSACS
jgi:hypothetical protein